MYKKTFYSRFCASKFLILIKRFLPNPNFSTKPASYFMLISTLSTVFPQNRELHFSHKYPPNQWPSSKIYSKFNTTHEISQPLARSPDYNTFFSILIHLSFFWSDIRRLPVHLPIAHHFSVFSIFWPVHLKFYHILRYLKRLLYILRFKQYLSFSRKRSYFLVYDE